MVSQCCTNNPILPLPGTAALQKPASGVGQLSNGRDNFLVKSLLVKQHTELEGNPSQRWLLVFFLDDPFHHEVEKSLLKNISKVFIEVELCPCIHRCECACVYEHLHLYCFLEKKKKQTRYQCQHKYWVFFMGYFKRKVLSSHHK